MEYLKLGTINDTFSLDGTLKIYSTTNLGKLRYKNGATIYISSPDNGELLEFKVLSYRHSGLFDFVKVENITTPEEAIKYKGRDVLTIKNQSDLDDGYYFYSDLVGCKIVDKNENNLGIVRKIEEFPAHITLRVSHNGKEYFVPFIPEFIKDVNIENKIIIIETIEGLVA